MNSSPTSAPEVRTTIWWAVLLGIPVVAHLPLYIIHLQQIWLRTHYQFFPLVLAGTAVLAFVRWPTGPLQAGNRWAVLAGFAAAWPALTLAYLLPSPWLAAVALMAAIPASVYAVGGGVAWRRLRPAWAMLWFVVPPPLDLDRELILQLQTWTTAWSSAVLDVLQVFHLVDGNVIEVDGRRLLVDQACSGVNSLLSLLAATVFAILATGRGWGRGIVLIAAAVGWVLVANVARVVLIVVADVRWGTDLSAGWRHEAVGVAFFLAAAALLMSTDQLLTFLFGASAPAVTPAPVVGAARRPAIGLAAGVAVAYAALLAVGYTGPAADDAARPFTPPELTEDDLPAFVVGWERKGFHAHVREPGSFFGERSAIWSYHRRDRSAIVSLDYPFPSWHDLTRCYTGQGWRIEGQEVYAAADLPGGAVEVRLAKPGFRHGVLLFAEFTPQGEPLAARRGGPRMGVFRHELAVKKLEARLFGRPAEGPAGDPPGAVYQFQLFVESPVAVGGQEMSELREVFARLREKLIVKTVRNR